MSLQAIELNSDDGQRSGHGNFQFCAKRLRYSCRVALCAFFRLCEVPRCGSDHGNSLSSTTAATSPSSTAAWRCLTTPDCAPHSDVRVDSAGTRARGCRLEGIHPHPLAPRSRGRAGGSPRMERGDRPVRALHGRQPPLEGLPKCGSSSRRDSLRFTSGSSSKNEDR